MKSADYAANDCIIYQCIPDGRVLIYESATIEHVCEKVSCVPLSKTSVPECAHAYTSCIRFSDTVTDIYMISMCKCKCK